jgi:hypothetical protein
MDASNVIISKKTRGIGFLLVNGKVTTVRSGKPVGATLLSDKITSAHKDIQFTGAKRASVRVEEGVSAPVSTPESKTAIPTLQPPVEQKRKVEAAPQPIDVEQFGERVTSWKKTEEKRNSNPYIKGNKKNQKGKSTDDGGF